MTNDCEVPFSFRIVNYDGSVNSNLNYDSGPEGRDI